MKFCRWTLLNDINCTLSMIPPTKVEILKLACLAPSAHNMQPWKLQIINDNHWILGTDMTRWLPAVDGTNRETFISLGAFSENIAVSAKAFGFKIARSFFDHSNTDEKIMSMELTKFKKDYTAAKLIRSRKTIRSGFSSKQINTNDLNLILKDVKENVFYIPTGSTEARLLAERTSDSFSTQVWRDDAQQEFVDCFRLKKKDVLKYGYGFTSNDMPISKLSRWYLDHFAKPTDFMKPYFRIRSISTYAKLTKQGAGWLIITTPKNDRSAYLQAGMVFMKIALRARKLNIAIHPMSQILAEGNQLDGLLTYQDTEIYPQLILRIGYVDQYTEPTSLRMPLNRWVKEKV